MGYDIGPRIGIQGEKEFNQQIKTINNNLKEYGSEMKALTSKFQAPLVFYLPSLIAELGRDSKRR